MNFIEALHDFDARYMDLPNWLKLVFVISFFMVYESFREFVKVHYRGRSREKNITQFLPIILDCLLFLFCLIYLICLNIPV